MKTEINLDNKVKFFAQYFGQEVRVWKEMPKDVCTVSYASLSEEAAPNSCLQLKPISSVTDEDAIAVGRLAHQHIGNEYNVTRQRDIIYIQTPYDKYGIQHFISIIPSCGTVCATINFAKTEKEEWSSNTVNIGQISLSSERPVPYIAIIDYLRQKGYAMPWRDISVKKMVEAGWITLTE